jgi:hypothetical protein
MMKKILYGILIIGVAMTSCKKENSRKSGPEPLQKIVFNVGFSKTVTGFQLSHLKTNSTTPDTSLTNYIDVLYYMVFDAGGNDVHNITQLSTDTAFGHYIDNLQAGSYTVVVAGGKAGFSIFNGSLSTAYLYYDSGGTQNPQHVPGFFTQDAFVSKTAVTVAATASNHAFALDRIVSKIVVNINDQVPASTTQIQANINFAANIYKIGDGSTATGTNGTFNPFIGGNVAANAIGTTNYQMSGLILNNSSHAIDVEIIATGTGGTILADKSLSNVSFQPNKETLLSGNLFGGSGGTANGFRVVTDTTWNTPVARGF